MIPARKRTAARLLCGAALLSPAAVHAAAPEATSPIATPDEIIVTAEKRSSRLIDVPSAISALGNRDLAERAIDGNADLSRIVPSLSFIENAPGQSVLALRGITTALALAPSVGVYLDETPLDLRTDEHAATPDIDLFDIARVEVLRGPQGTLFGAASLGGTIRYIQNTPDLNSSDFHVELSGGGVKGGEAGYAVKAAGGMPLTDRLAIRAVVTQERLSGYARRIEPTDYYALQPTDPIVARNLGQNDRTTAKIALLWQPDPDVTIEPSVYVTRTAADGYNYSDSNRPHYSFTGDVDPRFSDRVIVGNLTSTRSFAFGDLVSSTSYLDRRTHATDDYSPVAAFLYSQLIGSTTQLPIFHFVSYEPTDYSAFTQELRFASPSGRRWRYVIGGFFEHTHDESRQFAYSDAFGPLASSIVGAPPTTLLNGFDEPIIDRQIAGFANLDFELTHRLTLTAGLRAYDLRQATTVNQSGLFGGLSQGTINSRQSGVSPRASASYRFDRDVSVYATIARGFRPGLANAPLLVAPDGCPGDEAFKTTFGSDSVWNYEIGQKARIAGGRLSINSALYRIDWHDIQATAITVCGNYIANIGNARVQGFETEIGATPFKGATLHASFSTTDARIRSIRPDAAAANARPGDRVVGIPRTQFDVGGEYRLAVAPGISLYASGDVQYTGGAPAQYGVTDPRDRQPAYTNVNAAIGVDRGRLELELRARNLFDSYQINSVYSAFSVLVPADTVRYNVNSPRIVELVLRFRVGK